MCKHMTSKKISITEDVYNKLIKIKSQNESFSEFFLRLLNLQKEGLEKSFGAWQLSEKEKKEVWNDILNRPKKIWKKSKLSDNK